MNTCCINVYNKSLRVNLLAHLMHCHSLSINLTTSSCDHNSTHATALIQSKNFNAGICGEKNISEDLVLKSVFNSLVIFTIMFQYTLQNVPRKNQILNTYFIKKQCYFLIDLINLIKSTYNCILK